jgi:PKD repeat protein
MKRLFICVFGLSLLFLSACGKNNNNGTGGNLLPTITAMTPDQVSRGEVAITGHIQGTNLNGVTAVTLGDGITVNQVNGVSAVDIEVHFSVAVAAVAGPRTVTVTTTAGTASANAVLSVENNRAPIAKFTVSPTKGAKNTTFIADATESKDPDGNPLTYHWDFGDNKKANGRIATHKYSKPGTYQITLTVTDKNGTTSQVTHSVQVAPGLAPIPRFTITPSTGDVDTTFLIDGSTSFDGDGSIKRFEWRLGDGTRPTGAVISHKFRTDGMFAVELTVTDDDGLQSATEKDLRVEKFNEQAAIAAIQDVITRFFKRFSKLDKLTAEQIVEDWSTSPQCPGRDHEINIILHQQKTLQRTNAEILGTIDVFIHPTHVIANATVTASFHWIENDGTPGSGKATHQFQFDFEGGQWLICNFAVTAASAETKALFE